MNALEDLARVLAAALEAGEHPPCCYPDTGALWLSESREERDEAAAHCDGCTIFDACRAAGESAGLTGGHATFGVWAGGDRTRQPGKKNPTTAKENAS